MRAALAALLLLASCATSTADFAGGTSGHTTAVLDGTPIEVFTYRPDGCTITATLLVFHGLDRNASTYRDDAVPLARRGCMMIVAPLFDRARFPTWRYQRGGVVHNGLVQPRNEWTIRFVPLLADWARGQLGRPDLPYDQIGHSAGAQFLSRVVAYGTGGARHSIVANPSTWVRPSTEVDAPYGLGLVNPPAEADAALRRYLATPVTVLLGREDTGRRNLVTNEDAEEQGATRLARGETVFHEAEEAARAHAWPLAWRLAVVPAVGHDARAMFGSAQAFTALGL